MPPDWKPEGYASVSPYLLVKDGAVVIAFLEKMFGGRVVRRMDRPDGSLLHADVAIDDSVVMLGGAAPGWDDLPSHIHIYVEDVDAVYGRGLAAGGESVQPPEQKDDPDRRAGIRGPGGHTWWIGTQVG